MEHFLERFTQYLLNDIHFDIAEWSIQLLDSFLTSIELRPKYAILSVREHRFSVLIEHTNLSFIQEQDRKIYFKDIPADLLAYLRSAHKENAELQVCTACHFKWRIDDEKLYGAWLPIPQINGVPTFIVIFSDHPWQDTTLQAIQAFWQEAKSYVATSYYRIQKHLQCQQETHSLQQQLQALEISQQAMHENAINFLKVHKQLTDSLQYAKKMQQAILPAERVLKENFEEYFVIYLPKDIVSGDFYWFSQVDFTFIAVVDCTGHGVPGAFMSMIGNTLLNEIINIKRVSNPAQIISLLHIGIRFALNQDETQNLDGMDIGLCRLELTDTFDLKVTFAGARNNLYILQNGKVNVLKGNRTHIGGISEAELQFDNQTIILQEGDIMYLLTDGLIDNPNEKRQKFGLTRFLHFITTHKHIPLVKQKVMLENLIKEHQKNVAQRDDITVIALKP